MSGTETTRSIKIQYFALLREQRGCDEENYQTAAQTAEELYEELRKLHDFSLLKPALRVAVNGEIKPWNIQLGECDEVVFLPPVAGG